MIPAFVRFVSKLSKSSSQAEQKDARSAQTGIRSSFATDFCAGDDRAPSSYMGGQNV
jgi:hypothetical protein